MDDKNNSEVVYFYSLTEEPYGCFSNFSRHGVSLDGEWWPTTEHYFQAQKFVGSPDYTEVLKAKTPKEAARIGRERHRPLRPNWEEVKDEVMRKAVMHKFATHAGLREILLAIGDKPIVENAPGDFYWGCGADGSGKNMLGQILVEMREALRNQQSSLINIPDKIK